MVDKSDPKPRVIVTRRLPPEIEARMNDLFSTQLRRDDSPMSQSELKNAAANCEVLVPTVTDIIDSDVINAAKGL